MPCKFVAYMQVVTYTLYKEVNQWADFTLLDLSSAVIGGQEAELAARMPGGEEYLLALGHLPQDSEESSQAGAKNIQALITLTW